MGRHVDRDCHNCYGMRDFQGNRIQHDREVYFDEYLGRSPRVKDVIAALSNFDPNAYLTAEYQMIEKIASRPDQPGWVDIEAPR